MTLSDIIFEMELGGVDNGDISAIVNMYKEQELPLLAIDEILIKKGYPPILTVGQDDYDDFDDYDNGFEERSYHKRDWEE